MAAPASAGEGAVEGATLCADGKTNNSGGCGCVRDQAKTEPSESRGSTKPSDATAAGDMRRRLAATPEREAPCAVPWRPPRSSSAVVMRSPPWVSNGGNLRRLKPQPRRRRRLKPLSRQCVCRRPWEQQTSRAKRRAMRPPPGTKQRSGGEPRCPKAKQHVG